MTIAFLIVSISLMNAVGAYNLKETRDQIYPTFLNLIRAKNEVPCREVKDTLSRYKVIDEDILSDHDEDILSEIQENDNAKCIGLLYKFITQSSTIREMVEDETMITAMKALICLRKRHNTAEPRCKWESENLV